LEENWRRARVGEPLNYIAPLVIVMAQGQVVAIGSPEQLCAQRGMAWFEDAFIQLIGTDEGIAA
jgi:ABC-type Na+ transport system ATPase subunit NatA